MRSNSAKIAKNTLLLYFRMIILMLISLYTSRVVLEALGVDDYGIYNVVGGFVSMFSLISASLSGAASRFLNFSMGKGDCENLKTVFSSTLTIHIGLALLVALFAEIIGVWFLNNKMVIPEDRLDAANVCFQLSLLTFCSNLVTVPYNASIIAHEHMSTFAYVSIFEGIAKLIISYLIVATPFDNLIFYATSLCLLQLTLQSMYRYYCIRQFPECKYKFVYEKSIFYSLLSYSGWGFIGSSSGILRTQGINVLINLFFGPSINAARGVSSQVLSAVNGFVSNFMTAVKPQITQSYAAGNYSYMNNLIYASTKFTFFLFLIISLPVMLHADFLLGIWLKNVPDHSINFVRLTLIYTLITTLSHPLSIAQAATGKIRNYQLIIGGLQLLNLPICYILLKMRFEAEVVLFVSIVIAAIVVPVSMYMIRKLIPIDLHYFSKIIMRVFFVAIVSVPLPLIFMGIMPDTFLFRIFQIAICLVSTSLMILIFGCEKKERDILFKKLHSIIHKFQ